MVTCKEMLGIGAAVDASLPASPVGCGLEAVVLRLAEFALRKQAAISKPPSIEPTRPARGGKRRPGAGPRQKRVAHGAVRSDRAAGAKAKALAKPKTFRAKKVAATSAASAAASGSSSSSSASSEDDFDAETLIAAIDRELEAEKVSAMIPYIGRSSYAQHGVRTADVFEKERQRRKKGKARKLANLLY